ncbi:MAG TPA: NAD kinase [Euzebyales bacterium]|nr:NAD kinase [Euzebyales bacterium]
MAPTTADVAMSSASRIALIADADNRKAERAADELRERYPFVPEAQADVGVVVGGDGFMLRTLHRLLDERRDLPLYGLNCGTVGFLLNRYEPQDLTERVQQARPTALHPIRLRAKDRRGHVTTRLAINEVSLLRASVQTARIRIVVDGDEQLHELLGDGLVVSTAAGSTAYNRSAGGPILPLTAPLLALTPVAAFQPRGWRGALLPSDAEIRLEVLTAGKRPVNAAADHHQVDDVHEVVIAEQPQRSMTLLFDRSHTLESRILAEQFR